MRSQVGISDDRGGNVNGEIIMPVYDVCKFWEFR